jgi:hypothetical protein
MNSIDPALPGDHGDYVVIKHPPKLNGPVKPKKFDWIDMSRWDDEPLPERQWAIRDHVPLNQAGLFSGEGGTAKASLG